MIEIPVIALIFFILIATGSGWAITYLTTEDRHQKEREVWTRQLTDATQLRDEYREAYESNLETDRKLSQQLLEHATQTTKETPMQTLDLSPAMIGKTIRIEKSGIVGTHNYIEGTLQNFDFDVTRLHSYGYDNYTGIHVTGLEATISGIELNLTGNETLTTIQ